MKLEERRMRKGCEGCEGEGVQERHEGRPRGSGRREEEIL